MSLDLHDNHQGHPSTTLTGKLRNTKAPPGSRAFVKLRVLGGLGVAGRTVKLVGRARRFTMAPDPSLRSGFRQQAPTFPFAKLRVRLTPAKRLNLLKKFRASTLTTLWEERTRLLGKRQAGRVHG